MVNFGVRSESGGTSECAYDSVGTSVGVVSNPSDSDRKTRNRDSRTLSDSWTVYIIN